MSGEEGNSSRPPALVPETYNSLSSSDENELAPTDTEEVEHADQLSYETISETPLDTSSEVLEEGSDSQEIFPPPAATTTAPPTNDNETEPHQPEQDLEGKIFCTSAFSFSDCGMSKYWPGINSSTDSSNVRFLD